MGLWRLTAHKISEIFGFRLTKKFRGKRSSVIEQIEHGHRVCRAYWKNAFLKQYEEFSTFLRNQLCSNNLSNFGLKKGLGHLDAVRRKFQLITDRFASCQAQWLNVHVDFPLLQRIALPITIGSVRYAGIKIHETRIIRLLEVLLHGGSNVSGWTSKQIHQTVLTTFGIAEKSYSLNQLRYGLRKLKGHALLQRDAHATPTTSPAKASRSRFCFSSSTSVCVAFWPTAASIIRPMPLIVPTANSKPPITKPTRPFKDIVDPLAA